MIIPIQVKMRVSVQKPIPLIVNTSTELIRMKVASCINYISGEMYEGEYEVTPTRETQILETALLSMRDNVTINPIPPEYGLITWNGAWLKVS